ncbi:hypothetical protein GBA52_016238 [Prunus armeniaca]|nr:hypothetical protein GBA52_016238 [Prunus armeniaca]
MDCLQRSNDQTQLCFNLKEEWRRTDIILLITLQKLQIGLYLMVIAKDAWGSQRGLSRPPFTQVQIHLILVD